MRATKRAEHAFKEAGKKTEDALKEVGDSVKEVFRGVEESLHSIKLPGWWGAGSTGRQPSTLAHPSVADPAVSVATAPTAQGSENDMAMRRHCAALERLVEIGLSPQAARVALSRLDAWLVSPEGAAEMAAAETAARGAGEHVLHVGDTVCLDGLVKNPGANGKTGTLQAYAAENLRWKVVLADGEVYWIKPRLLKLVSTRFHSWTSTQEANTQAMSGPNGVSLADSWARLEAREIELLEKEEALRKLQELLEVEVNERVLHQHAVAAFSTVEQLESGTLDAHSRNMGLDEDDDENEVEPDEMWDMDWARLPDPGSASSGTTIGRDAHGRAGVVGSLFGSQSAADDIPQTRSDRPFSGPAGSPSAPHLQEEYSRETRETLQRCGLEHADDTSTSAEEGLVSVAMVA